MSSTALDGVVAKIDASNSTMNLYTNFSQHDRITLNSTPCDQNSTGSCRALVSSFTPQHFGAFDVGRVTHQTEAQLSQCMNMCLIRCTGEKEIGQNHIDQFRNTKCYAVCDAYCNQDQTKDFI